MVKLNYTLNLESILQWDNYKTEPKKMIVWKSTLKYNLLLTLPELNRSDLSFRLKIDSPGNEISSIRRTGMVTPSFPTLLVDDW